MDEGRHAIELDPRGAKTKGPSDLERMAGGWYTEQRRSIKGEEILGQCLSVRGTLAALVTGPAMEFFKNVCKTGKRWGKSSGFTFCVSVDFWEWGCRPVPDGTHLPDRFSPAQRLGSWEHWGAGVGVEALLLVLP